MNNKRKLQSEQLFCCMHNFESPGIGVDGLCVTFTIDSYSLTYLPRQLVKLNERQAPGMPLTAKDFDGVENQRNC